METGILCHWRYSDLVMSQKCWENKSRRGDAVSPPPHSLSHMRLLTIEVVDDFLLGRGVLRYQVIDLLRMTKSCVIVLKWRQ